MISCTEFIPLYSEFFNFLDKKGGYDAVLEYWYHISDTSLGDLTNPNSMAYNCELYGGFEGARKYWSHTTSEEACDVYAIFNPVERYSYSEMRFCPSRAMLNSFTHITPYEHYCDHCRIIYSRVLEKYDTCYDRDQSEVANARCSSILYEKGHKPDYDFTVPNENCKVSHMKREGKKYLHRDFHLLGDNALKYCGDKFGDDTVRDFLVDYTKAFYAPQLALFREQGLPALEAWIRKLYETEEASEVLHTELTDTQLTVTIDHSPVIAFMKTLNQSPSKYYIEETRTLYGTIAAECGFTFDLLYYEENGATKFIFTAN